MVEGPKAVPWELGEKRCEREGWGYGLIDYVTTENGEGLARKRRCLVVSLKGKLPGEEDAAAFEKAIFAYGHLCHLLWCHFQTTGYQGRGLFTCTSKTHALCHSALLSRHLSPRLVWCFIGEDMMSTVQELTQGCTKGNTPFQGPLKSLEHWRIAMHLEWQQ